MLVIECLLLIGVFGIGLIASISDMKEGVIHNRVVALFAVFGFVLDTIYYGIFAHDIVGLFLLNALTTILIGLCLYWTHSLAGGDCKLIMVMSLLYPAGMYLTYGNGIITLFFSVCFSILYGYLYLLLISVWRIVVGDNKLDIKYMKIYLIRYFKIYLTAVLYVACANLLVTLISNLFFAVPEWAAWVVCMIIAWLCGRVEVFKNKYMIGVVALVVGCLAAYMRVIPFSLNPRTYLFTFVLVMCQMTIRTNIYETISTSRVKKGMILSVISSMALQSSRVKGLPGVSSEDLRDRLTEEEAESVRRWGKTAKGQKTIVIVKKIPFAIFIALGYLSYFLIWRIKV